MAMINTHTHTHTHNNNNNNQHACCHLRNTSTLSNSQWHTFLCTIPASSFLNSTCVGRTPLRALTHHCNTHNNQPCTCRINCSLRLSLLQHNCCNCCLGEEAASSLHPPILAPHLQAPGNNVLPNICRFLLALLCRQVAQAGALPFCSSQSTSACPFLSSAPHCCSAVHQLCHTPQPNTLLLLPSQPMQLQLFSMFSTLCTTLLFPQHLQIPPCASLLPSCAGWGLCIWGAPFLLLTIHLCLPFSFFCTTLLQCCPSAVPHSTTKHFVAAP